MTKTRKEFTLEPETIEYLKELPARTASKKVDEAINLLKVKEQNPEKIIEKPKIESKLFMPQRVRL